MTWLWDNAVTLSTLVMAIAAIAALIYAHLQIDENKRAERRANANELWRETLQLAFDNPKLSDPTLKLAQFDYEERTIDGSIETFQKYELYVDTILNASEEILEVSPTKEWDTAVRFQLKPHRDYLLSPYFQNSGYLEQYGAKFRTFLNDALDNPRTRPPGRRNSPGSTLRKRRQRSVPKLIIDNQEHDVPNGITLIQACGLAGIEIPRFCYHERLSIAGNCRMCLVEVAGMPKPVASCAMSVNDLRPGRDGTPPTIITNSPTVKKAREGVLEFLLINHPLDCPICDQGGECDLQDQTMAYGFDAGRFADNKRAVEDKYLGPLIETYMTRCIHCTRCIRFMTEVAGVEELGAIGRGEDMEITTYLEHGMMSELSGNVVDLCPVGALTSKPYAFMARPWELTKTQSIDVMDALGSNIRVDSRGREVMRVLPRVNDAINEEWISDKTRHVWDGLRVQRLDRPYLRRNGRLEAVTWDEAFRAIAERLRGLDGKRFAAIAGDLAAAEEMFALKPLAEQLGSPNIDCRQDGAKLDPALGRATYLFNATIEGIDHADAILLIGTNPRLEAPVLNSRILKRWRQTQGHVPIGLIGTQADLTYPYEHLGAGPETLAKLAGGIASLPRKDQRRRAASGHRRSGGSGAT